MRTSWLVALACLPLVAGCASVRHHPRALEPVGTALPVEVSVRPDRGDVPLDGVVHYRTAGAPSYEPMPMQHRAGQLFAILPTNDLGPDAQEEYYIDVQRDGKAYALGSPGAPFRTTFLDRTRMILAGLRPVVHASTPRADVQIVLLTGGAAIDQPTVEYCVPGMPGIVRVPMEPCAWGDYAIVVPARAVTAGTWRYAIEVPIDGEVFRLPRQGYGSFDVKVPSEPRRADRGGRSEHGERHANVTGAAIED